MTEQAEKQEELPMVATVTEVDNLEVLQILPSADESQGSDSPWLAVPVSGINDENPPQNLPQDSSACHLCQNRRFQDATSSVQDKQLLKACACDFHVHHGCLVDLVETQEKCLMCGVNYRFYKYGSKIDFCTKYWYRFAIIGAACLTLILCGVYGAWATFFPSTVIAFGLFATSCAAVIIGINVGSYFTSWMLNEGFTQFQHKYRSIAVFNYKPEISTPMSVVVRDQGVTPIDDVDASNLINLDVTVKLNQEEKFHTPGVMASTPCQTSDQLVKFSFDTPKHDSPV